MSIRKFRAGRVSTVTASEHIGQHGDVFYDESTGQFRVSNGTTPGGTVVATALNLANGTADVFVNNLTVAGTNTTINNIVSNNETTVTGVLTVTGNATFTGNTEFIGPSQFIGDTVFIGNVTEVGNLTITGKAINNGPSIFNGAMTITGDTSIVGNIEMTGNSSITGNTFVTGPTTVTGNITITGNSTQTGVSKYIVSTDSTNTGALTVTGNVSGLVQPPALPGVMLHVTGQDNGTTPGRSYFDAVGQYSILVGRRYNGTIANPTQVTAGQEVLRIAGTGYPTGGWPLTGLAQIRFIADESQTQTNRGGHIEFLTVPVGSNVVTLAMTVSATTGTTIAGNLTAGNVIANTIGTMYGSVVGTSGTFSGNVSANYLSGKLLRGVRNAGTIADGGTLTIDFSTDSIVHCVWGNGLTLAYQNYLPGRVIKVMAAKATGTGVDTLSLDGVTAAQVSTGLTTVSGSADQTVFIELISTNSSIAGVYVKL